MLKPDIVFKFDFFFISLILFQNMSKYLHDIKKSDHHLLLYKHYINCQLKFSIRTDVICLE